jgi:hypothetical protein
MSVALQAARPALPLALHLGDWANRSRPLVVYKPSGLPVLSQAMVRRGDSASSGSGDSAEVADVEDSLLHRVLDSSPLGAGAFLALPQCDHWPLDVGVGGMAALLSQQNRSGLVSRGLTVFARRREDGIMLQRSIPFGAVSSEYAVLCRIPRSVVENAARARVREEERRRMTKAKFSNPHAERHSMKVEARARETASNVPDAVWAPDVTLDPFIGANEGLLRVNHEGVLVPALAGRLEKYLSHGIPAELAGDSERRLAGLFQRSSACRPPDHPWLAEQQQLFVRSKYFAKSASRMSCRKLVADFRLVEQMGDLALYNVVVNGCGVERGLRSLFSACGCPVVNDFEHDMELAKEIHGVHREVLRALKANDRVANSRRQLVELGGPVMSVVAPLLQGTVTSNTPLADAVDAALQRPLKTSGDGCCEGLTSSSIQFLPFGVGIACVRVSFPDPLANENVRLLQTMMTKVPDGAPLRCLEEEEEHSSRWTSLSANFQFLSAAVAGGVPSSFKAALEARSALPSTDRRLAHFAKPEEEALLTCGKCGAAGHVMQSCTAVLTRSTHLQLQEKQRQLPTEKLLDQSRDPVPESESEDVNDGGDESPGGMEAARRALQLLVAEESEGKSPAVPWDPAPESHAKEFGNSVSPYALPLASSSLVAAVREGIHPIPHLRRRDRSDRRDPEGDRQRLSTSRVAVTRCQYCHGRHHVSVCPRLEGGGTSGPPPASVTQDSSGETPNISFCIRCGQRGHEYRSCPLAAKMKWRTSDFATRCFICGLPKEKVLHDEGGCPMRHPAPQGCDATGNPISKRSNRLFSRV